MRRWLTLAAGGLLAAAVLGGCASSRRRTKVDTLAGPHFAYDRAELSHDGRLKVWAAAATLNRYRKRRVLVNGFTDSAGTQEHNLRLSQRRAETVRECLVQDGVDPARISTRAYGMSNPTASNATAEGRAQNRRVEIVLE